MAEAGRGGPGGFEFHRNAGFGTGLGSTGAADQHGQHVAWTAACEGARTLSSLWMPARAASGVIPVTAGILKPKSNGAPGVRGREAEFVDRVNREVDLVGGRGGK
ncbi:MAG: hypothetical protein M3Y07_15945 [Acidobacteriota bacterium]|nr:hypothetical protein [Acidobacteriota bacterium]